MADESSGRNLVGENSDSTEFYVGVDPMYQNYANEGEKPYPFHEEEITAKARAGGISEGERSGFEAMLLDAPGVDEDDDVTPDDDKPSPTTAPPVAPPAAKS